VGKVCHDYLFFLLAAMIAVNAVTIVSGRTIHFGNSGIVLVGNRLKFGCCVGELEGIVLTVGLS